MSSPDDWDDGGYNPELPDFCDTIPDDGEHCSECGSTDLELPDDSWSLEMQNSTRYVCLNCDHVEM